MAENTVHEEKVIVMLTSSLGRKGSSPSRSSDGVWKTQLGSVALAWGLDASWMGSDA